MKMILPIKYSYVPTWGLWEAVREIVQNGQDEKEQNGSPLRVRHNGEFLIVENDGAHMDRKVLLLGQTSKEGQGLRGHFGEGLNLAMLSAVRAGHEMQVLTSTEIWEPAIESRAEFGNEQVLVVKIKKRHRTQSTKHVTVRIKMKHEEWEGLKDRFLFLEPPKKSYEVRFVGTILMDAKHAGCFYSKGIFVTRSHNSTKFGYDFANIDLDRDRRMIDPWNAEYTMGNILTQALAQKPEMFVNDVFEMLSSNSIETKSLQYHMDKDSKPLGLLLEKFKAENGENALPVQNMSESREIEHYGRKGVVVSSNLAVLLQKQSGTFQEIQKDLKSQSTKLYSWSDLSESEHEVILWAEERFKEIGIVNINVSIADFADTNLSGMFESGTNRILVRRSDLSDRYEYLATLVHEVAHWLESAKDGEHEHVGAIERIWRDLYKQRCI